jgi:uncharacterized membrane protein YphA (DoxX/SURF4 family)
LLYDFRRAEHHAVFGFLQTFMRETVIPHFTTWAALVFAVELIAGALLTLGVWTRAGALVGTVQSILITLLIVRAPNEWFWTYATLILLNVICLVAITDERLSLEPALRRFRARVA